MCGIAGFTWNDSSLLKQMTDVLQHRGPDDEGGWSDGVVSLGHRRLAIIDLSERGLQPMHYDRYHIVFNGEMYNFKEVKTALEQQGHAFVSDSDTEVILHAYQQWGADCVNRFNGMWALALYDTQNQTLFLSRDRFGIKPLFYSLHEGNLIFASEIKAIRQWKRHHTINTKALNWYFYQKYVGDNLTIFDGIYKLRAAENMLFDLRNRTMQLSLYYNVLAEIQQHQQRPLKQRVEELQQLLPQAVQAHLLADVPVGCFLSGGVDSSLVTALTAQQHANCQTFSIGFNDKSYNELPYSQQASQHIGTNHYYEYCNIDEQLIAHVVGSFDEPFGDSSVIPAYLLSGIARKKATVALSGDAGDELFGGYDSYKAYAISRFVPAWLVRAAKKIVDYLPVSDRKLNIWFKIRKYLTDYVPSAYERHYNLMSQCNEPARQPLLQRHYLSNSEIIPFNTGNSLTDIQLADIKQYMPEDILRKVDIASMLQSLEVRVPLLDVRVAALALSLPDNFKVQRLQTKWWLKKYAALFLPKNIVYRQKRGFSVPIARWIRESKLINTYLTDNKYYSHGFLDHATVLEWFTQHNNRRSDHSRPLWLVFVFNYWYYNVFELQTSTNTMQDNER